MSKTIPCRKVYEFRMEPTEIEALELERTVSVARYTYNWGLERCQECKPRSRVEAGKESCALRRGSVITREDDIPLKRGLPFAALHQL